MPNYYHTSNGERVTQATIDRRRSDTYRRRYAGNPWPACCGCGRPAQGTMHFVPQAVCKAEGKAEYCWLDINMGEACHRCNEIAENPKSPLIKKLFCYERILSVTKLVSEERYQKLLWGSTNE